MGLEALTGILVQFAIGVLKWWAGREDIKRSERQRLLIEALELEEAALGWMVEALRDPGRHAALRVRIGLDRLSDFSPAPDPPGPPDGGNVPRGG